jgi:Na+-transporting methylmalonyl-CoA/oxaloacetate decarboxylase gamma subunit
MSNKKINVFFIIMLAFFVACLAPAMAFSEDFSLEYQKQQISACSCGLTADSYVIRNTGDVTSTYQFFKDGSAAQYSTFSENFFSLEPGQSKDITNYINLPCDYPANYNEKINVSTIFGVSKTFEQEISAGKCTNFEIIPIETVQSSCPCSPVKYDIFVKNSGSYDEVFTVTVPENTEYAALSEKSFTIAPNENKTVSVYFNFPCSVYGDKNLYVEIEAQRSDYIATVPLKLKIGDCYDYNINSNSQFTVCEGEAINSLIEIKNSAEFSNTFTLETSQKYAKIENNSIALPPNQSGSTNLLVDAFGLSAGNYSFKIISSAEKGNFQKELPADVNVEKCRDFIMEITSPKTEMIASKNYDYELYIENTGTKPGNFNIKVEGPGWLLLEKNRTSLAAGETGKVLLKANIPADFVGADFARITVDEDFISDSQRLVIKAKTVDEAYLADIKIINDKIAYDFSDVNFSIDNNGVETATYNLALEGPEWMSLPQNAVTLAPGESALVPIRTSPTNETPEGTYEAIITATVADAGIAYSSTFNIALSSAPWYMKAFYLIAPFFLSYWLYIVIVMAAIVILIFLIWLIKALAKRAAENRKIKKEIESTKVVVEEPVISKYQAKFQPFVTPSIIPEETPRFQIPEMKEKRQINWARIFGIIFLLLVIGGIIALALINWGAIAGVFAGLTNHTTQQPTGPSDTTPSENYSPELEINRSTGVEGEGNVVYVRGEGLLDIPVTIKNRAPAKVIYTINNVNASWISTDKRIIALDINSSETMHLLVNTTPDLPDGTYQISLGLNINEQDLKYSEKIELRIEREKPTFEKYLPYIIAGVVVAILLILIIALTRKSRFDVKHEKSDIEIVRVRDTEKKGIFGKIIIILIILAIIAGTSYYVYNLPKDNTGAEYDENLDLGSTENQTIGIDMGLGDQVVIPFIFSNGFEESASYRIDSSAEWIASTSSRFSLEQGETAYVNITAFPDNTAQEGIYQATIDVDISERDIEYTKTIVFNLKDRSLGKTLIENKFFVIGVAIVIVGLLLLASFKKKKKEKREFLAEIRQEIEMEKEKRKMPKTKIPFKTVSKKRK